MKVYAVFVERRVSESQNLIGETFNAEYQYDDLIAVYENESAALQYVAMQINKHDYRIESYDLKK